MLGFCGLRLFLPALDVRIANREFRSFSFFRHTSPDCTFHSKVARGSFRGASHAGKDGRLEIWDSTGLSGANLAHHFLQPIRDDIGAINGIFCVCSGTTNRVLGERRLRTLRDLGQKVTMANSAEQACEIAETLAGNPYDIPFSLIYLLDAGAAYSRTEDRLRALQAGYQIHIPKPIEYAELITVMASLVNRRNESD